MKKYICVIFCFFSINLFSQQVIYPVDSLTEVEGYYLRMIYKNNDEITSKFLFFPSKDKRLKEFQFHSFNYINAYLSNLLGLMELRGYNFFNIYDDSFAIFSDKFYIDDLTKDYLSKCLIEFDDIQNKNNKLCERNFNSKLFCSLSKSTVSFSSKDGLFFCLRYMKVSGIVYLLDSCDSFLDLVCCVDNRDGIFLYYDEEREKVYSSGLSCATMNNFDSQRGNMYLLMPVFITW